MTIEQKRRELFEAWYEDYTHRHGWISNAGTWECFNTALDAVVIELPREWDDTLPEDDDGHQAEIDAANEMQRACLDAIQSTGLGIKVK
jgi:hypothetical protein